MIKKIVLIFLGFFLIFYPFFIKAGELEDLTKELESLKKELSKKESNYQDLKTRLNSIKSRLFLLEQEITKKEQEVKKGEETLIYQKNLLNEKAKSYYKNMSKNSSNLLAVLISTNISKSLREFFYQKSLVNKDKETIIKIVLYIKRLEEIKSSLENEKKQLAFLNKEIENQTKILEREISETKQKIAQLTAKQQELIAKKFASIYIPRSASIVYDCRPDYNPRTNEIKDSGFSPKFGFFTFGVPNRVGMNQWGAKGRADVGQNFEEILRAYYNFDTFQKYDVNTKIKVQGYGEFSLEDYVLRIYEVPESWPLEALKAQAVAARSYALRYVEDLRNNNKSDEICTTEDCQVFKPDPKQGQWATAVKETEGLVMIKDGVPIKAWYSSTHGGYIFNSSAIGWQPTSWTKDGRDTKTSVSNFKELFEQAYDRDSPIFYCNWGYRKEYNNTGWLKSEEVADIINVILLARIDSNTRRFLYQVDAGGDVWNEQKVKEELKKRGVNPFNNVYSANISADFNQGKVLNVSFSGDGGSFNSDGAEFKDWFNARAPSNIQIRGPLYNVEIK